MLALPGMSPGLVNGGVNCVLRLGDRSVTSCEPRTALRVESGLINGLVIAGFRGKRGEDRRGSAFPRLLREGVQRVELRVWDVSEQRRGGARVVWGVICFLMDLVCLEGGGFLVKIPRCVRWTSYVEPQSRKGIELQLSKVRPSW